MEYNTVIESVNLLFFTHKCFVSETWVFCQVGILFWLHVKLRDVQDISHEMALIQSRIMTKHVYKLYTRLWGVLGVVLICLIYRLFWAGLLVGLRRFPRYGLNEAQI